MARPQNQNVLTDDEKLVRYLKTGTQSTFFLPGKNKVFKMFDNPMLNMINQGRGKDAVAELVRIDREKSYLKREPMLYLLAVAAHSSDLETKRAAFACFNDVCSTPVDLFVVLKHMKSLSQFTKGWGRALRRAVCEWYNTKDPFQLAELVTRYKSHGRWSHIDVLRLAHIKPANENIGFVVKVITKGLEEAKKTVGEDASPELRRLLEYFVAVETVKHQDDGVAVARIMETHNLSMDHIPTPLLASKEVWSTLLSWMSFHDLLDHLPGLARRGFLTIPSSATAADSVTKVVQAKVLEKVKDSAAIEQECISPFGIYIAIRNYMKVFTDQADHSCEGAEGQSVATQTTVTANELDEYVAHPQKKKRKKKKRKGKEGGQDQNENHPKTNDHAATSAQDKVTANNPVLYDALHVAFRVAVEKNIPTTDKRFLVAVKASLSAVSQGIRGCPCLRPLEVMALLATFIKKKEKTRELGFYTSMFSKMNYHSEVQDLIQAIGSHAAPVPGLSCDPAAPITWALEKKKKYDVFLILSDGGEAKGDITPADKLAEYREKMKLPDTKVVLCGLTSSTMDYAQLPGMLDIGGFDVTVPTLIYKFINGEL